MHLIQDNNTAKKQDSFKSYKVSYYNEALKFRMKYEKKPLFAIL